MSADPKRWMYEVATLTGQLNPVTLANTLNKLGEEGWEACFCLLTDEALNVVVKKEKPLIEVSKVLR